MASRSYVFSICQSGAGICTRVGEPGKRYGRMECIPNPTCFENMVGLSGSDGVADSQLSSSSYWCDSHHAAVPDCNAARYARLNATGLPTGAWAPSSINTKQWIPVDFNEQRVISGIVLKGRDQARANMLQWVTSFKVLCSTDCVDWSYIVDDEGNPKVFEGTSGPDIVVECYLPESVLARCVRVNPITWNGYIAVRFDVLGCSV